MGSRNLHAAGLLLLLMLPMLQAVPARMLDMENGGEDASGLENADKDDSAEPEVQIEATKRLWIEELTAKAESTEESADLIEEIRTRNSGSGLRHLKAACRAMCARCVCGVILMPSFPTGHAGKSGPTKLAIKKTIPTAKPDAKPAVKKLPTKITIKLATKTPPSAIKVETDKKAKKWLLGMEHQPDFLLDEDISGSVYKRDVGDHDPLSESGDAQSHFGID